MPSENSTPASHPRQLLVSPTVITFIDRYLLFAMREPWDQVQCPLWGSQNSSASHLCHAHLPEGMGSGTLTPLVQDHRMTELGQAPGCWTLEAICFATVRNASLHSLVCCAFGSAGFWSPLDGFWSARGSLGHHGAGISYTTPLINPKAEWFRFWKGLSPGLFHVCIPPRIAHVKGAFSKNG